MEPEKITKDRVPWRPSRYQQFLSRYGPSYLWPPNPWQPQGFDFKEVSPISGDPS